MLSRVVGRSVPLLGDRSGRVIIVPEGGEFVSPLDERARHWDDWVRRGLHGPLGDEDEPELA